MRSSTLGVLFLVPAILAAEVSPSEKYTVAERRHWAFQPRLESVPPKTAPLAIDAFVREKLDKAGLRPAPAAPRAALIRRLYFDVTGLPPSPEAVRDFVASKDPKAYEKLVDSLLASRSYAEKWATHWLDVVRFAETDGFEYDTHRPDAWRYRDYVIDSFHQDKPYDRFITEQLAGDEIDPKSPEMRVASGFQRLGALRKNAGNQEVASSRNEVLTEMTNIVGAAFLGVTLGCARCHDHKFDPIRHKDYYRIQAFFAATHDKDMDLATAEEKEAYSKRKSGHDAEIKQLRAQMRGLKGEERGHMLQRIRNLEEVAPTPPPSVFSVSNDFSKMSPVHVLARGDYQNKGEKVGMRTLGVLLPDGAPELDKDLQQPRLTLAKWVADPSNPLTARVIANRVWHYHFGRGIVPTPNDFGRMGGRPSNRELLDYLANRLVAGGWKLKPLHREILLSQTYRQSSENTASAALGQEKDPDNELLWKFSRRRLEAEEIRDAMLAVSGRINRKEGGPSIIVPADEELVNLLYKPSQWAVSKDVTEHDRRSVYLMHKRNLRLPFLEVFDAPDMQISCPRRESSTHAPQALELMNGDFANLQAKALASRLDREAHTPAEQVDRAYWLAAGRAPTPKEKAVGIEFLKKNPLSEFSLAILNLNAFLYIN